MKIFVTGSNGFVGRALISELKKRNIDYVAADRNLYGDIVTQSHWKDLLTGVDVIVHLAARVHVMKEVSADPLIAFREMSVNATVNLARAAKESGVKRFVFISSIKVNGESTSDFPFTARDIPNPQDPYGISKMEAEIQLLQLHDPGIFEVVIIRPPLIYGPGVKANFKNLMWLVEKDLPIPFGRVNNKRSLVSVFNLVDLIILSAIHPLAGGNVFLVSDDSDLSLNELILLMAKVLGKSAHLLPVPVGLMKFAATILGKKSYADRLLGNLQVDISATKQILNWSPPLSFEDTFRH
jgi:nucleoside-diphosphate-sugar epimerase